MDKISDSNVTIIIPTLNEEGNIGNTIIELNRMGYHHIVVVDGNSKDRTIEIAKEFGASVVIQNGKGKGDALCQVFNHDGLNDIIIMMDADGSMDPKEISLFIKTLKSGADIVKGSRFLPNGYSTDITHIRRLGNKILVFLVNLIWRTNYTDLCYGFMAFKKEVLKKLSSYLEAKKFDIEAEICIKAKKLKFKVVEIPSVESRRRHGKSNLNSLIDGAHIFCRIFTELFK
ncbi:MAG: glycosyltransferase family 2 protein [Candidatus Njordarchaeales archaeon]